MEEEKTRLRVKLGAAEIEYEGGTDFLKDEVMPTVSKILEMVETRADLQRSPPPLQIERAAQEVTSLPSGNNEDHSTNTIATLLVQRPRAIWCSRRRAISPLCRSGSG
jgi:hypothetical protein